MDEFYAAVVSGVTATVVKYEFKRLVIKFWGLECGWH